MSAVAATVAAVGPRPTFATRGADPGVRPPGFARRGDLAHGTRVRAGPVRQTVALILALGPAAAWRWCRHIAPSPLVRRPRVRPALVALGGGGDDPDRTPHRTGGPRQPTCPCHEPPHE